MSPTCSPTARARIPDLYWLTKPLIDQHLRTLRGKEKGRSQVRNGLFDIWLNRVDEFRNWFLYENIPETNAQFQAVELAIARM
jgi:hypothetical protein